MIQFSDKILSHYFGDFSGKPRLELADLRQDFPRSDQWSAIFAINSNLFRKFNSKYEPLICSLLFRTEILFASYHVARSKLIDYVENWQMGNPGFFRYSTAIGASEAVFFNIQIVYDLSTNGLGTTIDGIEGETRSIGNRIKHVTEDIVSGKLSTPGRPLWLSEDHFCTISKRVSYLELSEQVRMLANLADAFSNPNTVADALDRLFSN